MEGSEDHYPSNMTATKTRPSPRSQLSGFSTITSSSNLTSGTPGTPVSESILDSTDESLGGLLAFYNRSGALGSSSSSDHNVINTSSNEPELQGQTGQPVLSGAQRTQQPTNQEVGPEDMGQGSTQVQPPVVNHNRAVQEEVYPGYHYPPPALPQFLQAGGAHARLETRGPRAQAAPASYYVPDRRQETRRNEQVEGGARTQFQLRTTPVQRGTVNLGPAETLAHRYRSNQQDQASPRKAMVFTPGCRASKRNQNPYTWNILGCHTTENIAEIRMNPNLALVCYAPIGLTAAAVAQLVKLGHGGKRVNSHVSHQTMRLNLAEFQRLTGQVTSTIWPANVEVRPGEANKFILFHPMDKSHNGCGIFLVTDIYELNFNQQTTFVRQVTTRHSGCPINNGGGEKGILTQEHQNGSGLVYLCVGGVPSMVQKFPEVNLLDQQQQRSSLIEATEVNSCAHNQTLNYALEAAHGKEHILAYLLRNVELVMFTPLHVSFGKVHRSGSYPVVDPARHLYAWEWPELLEWLQLHGLDATESREVACLNTVNIGNLLPMRAGLPLLLVVLGAGVTYEVTPSTITSWILRHALRKKQ